MSDSFLQKIRFIATCILVFFSLNCASGAYYDSWNLVSPRNEQVIKSGELLIIVKLTDSVKIFKGSFQLLLDDELITSQVKFSPTQISVLYTLPLAEGKHSLELRVKAMEVGFLKPIKSSFYINKFSGSKKDSVIIRRADFFEFSGNISGNYKQYQTSGPGKDLSQAPPYFRDMNIDVLARFGKLSLPFRYYNTSDQILYPPVNGLISRNYLEYGVRFKSLEFLIGDHNPVFDRLVLTGVRIKGYKFSITTQKFQMQIIDGISQYGQEGQVLRYNPAYGLAPPPDMIRDTIHKQRDSTYILPGIYKRHLSAARFSFGNRLEGSTFGISILRSRDDTGSIKFGVNPSDNIVVGADEAFVTNGNAMKVNAGIAASLFTSNIARGPITESAIDSFFGYKYGINPRDIRNIFIINTNTIKPGEPATAGYFTSVFRQISQNKATENLLTLDYHYYGSSYVSYGNPFARNDLWVATAQDQIALFNRKLMITGRYSFEEDNVSANEFATLRTQLIYGSILIAPSQNLPQLNLMVNNQIRSTPGVPLGNFGAVSDNYLSMTASLIYNLKIQNTITTIAGSFTNSIRTDAINTFSTNTTQIITGGITESLTKMNLILDAHYNILNYETPESPMSPLSTTLDGHIRYQIKKIKITFGVGASITESNLNSYFGANSQSTRDIFTINISTQIFPGAILDLEAGMTPYTDLTYSANNYSLNYGMIRLIYNFDFRR